MLIDVVCPSCGLPIGHLATLFNKLREERTRELVEKVGGDYGDISYLTSHNAQTEIDMADVLDKMRIYGDCCRLHMVTKVMWAGIY